MIDCKGIIIKHLPLRHLELVSKASSSNHLLHTKTKINYYKSEL